ncbi:NUDIX hydrolase [Egbenema bharatensis]|uniref:NUDIX hydrolase n=1 Tax=Egbenema bharatensis TaxID=3463334 RepID=UPI003A85ABF5
MVKQLSPSDHQPTPDRDFAQTALLKGTALIAELEAHQPYNSAEREFLSQTIAFLQAHPHNWYDRHNLKGHITASAWIVAADAVLLTHHRKLNQWFQLGGHCDEPDVMGSAFREAIEESGLKRLSYPETIFDVDVHLIPERKGIPAHHHFDIRYCLVGDRSEPLMVSSESHDLRWVPLTELEHYTQDPSVLRMRDKPLAIN